MTWCDDIDAAMQRGKSPYNALDVLGWVRDGNASFAATERMSASVWWNGPSGPEIGHICGEWNDEDARWLLEVADRECRERGVDCIAVQGRKAWRRFLRIKGITQ